MRKTKCNAEPEQRKEGKTTGAENMWERELATRLYRPHVVHKRQYLRIYLALLVRNL